MVWNLGAPFRRQCGIGGRRDADQLAREWRRDVALNPNGGSSTSDAYPARWVRRFQEPPVQELPVQEPTCSKVRRMGSFNSRCGRFQRELTKGGRIAVCSRVAQKPSDSRAGLPVQG